MAYFGYPVEFKNAASNAIRSGLLLIDGMSELKSSMQTKFGIDLDVRISIHTGIVVMADLGLGNRKERLALGEAPNIAARLQGLAPTNGIAVSQVTYLHSKDHFEFKPLGFHVLKGITEKMEVFQPLREIAN